MFISKLVQNFCLNDFTLHFDVHFILCDAFSNFDVVLYIFHVFHFHCIDLPKCNVDDYHNFDLVFLLPVLFISILFHIAWTLSLCSCSYFHLHIFEPCILLQQLNLNPISCNTILLLDAFFFLLYFFSSCPIIYLCIILYHKHLCT